MRAIIKKTLTAISVLTLLASCISVKAVPNTTEPSQVFVTAMLLPTRAQFIPPTLTALPEPSTTPVPVTTSSVNCKDTAILLRDVTIPDDTHIKAGEKFMKTWEFQNTGTCPWAGYTIKFSSGDQMNAPLSAPIADTPPNGKVQVSVELTAPTADGRYTGNFTLLNAKGEVVPIGTQKTFWVRFIVGTYVAVAPTYSSVISTPSGNCSHGPNVNYVSEVISLINEARANAGLPALTANAEIAAIAQVHAEAMAFNNFLSHDGADGGIGDRMRRSGNIIFGEILAIGTPQNAMDQWRRDEHWDYVLGNFTQIGVGYAYNSCSDYGGYFTVDLG